MLDARWCPDCGLSVWMSLNSNDGFENSRPAWLRRTAVSLWLLAAMQLVALGAYGTAMLGYRFPYLLAEVRSTFVTPGGGGVNAADREGDEDADAEQLMEQELDRIYQRYPWLAKWAGGPRRGHGQSIPVAVAATLLGVYFAGNGAALWLVTGNERRYPDKLRRVRPWTRGAAAGTGVVGVLLVLAGMKALASGGWEVRGMGSTWALYGVEALFAVCVLATWAYLKPLAVRSGRGWLRRVMGWMMFLPVLTFAKALPFVGLWFLYLLTPLVQFVPLVYVPLSVWVMYALGRAMWESVPHAREMWTRERNAAGVTV
jgi:hypothetical protein